MVLTILGKFLALKKNQSRQILKDVDVNMHYKAKKLEKNAKKQLKYINKKIQITIMTSI